MITGSMTSELDGTARIWTLSVLEDPRPGQLVEWDEPACGAVPAREGVRGWISAEESTRPGTVIFTVAGEGSRWVIINVIPHIDGEAAPMDPQLAARVAAARAADHRFIQPSHHGSDGRPPASTTGQYDRQAEGAKLTEANAARIAADPFSTLPDDQAADPADTFLARDVKRGWHMAGVGTIDAIRPVGNDQLAFNGPEGERAFKRYSLVEVTRPAPVMWSAEWPYPEFTAAEFTAHYLLAAEVIAARGYNAEEMRGYDGTPGVSICTALKLAARERAQAADPQAPTGQIEITAANVTEELETRLSAVIYTLGLLHSRTGISDFSDQLAAWELGHYTTGPNPARSDALALLATAAGIFSHISDTQAEVTAPAVPGQ